MSTIRVAVTGAAGNVAYAMLARLASGEVFGPQNKVILHLLEIPKKDPPPDPTRLQPLEMCEGIALELLDCGFPTLQDVVVTDDANRAFKDCNWALLVGAFPRLKGMERNDLLSKNAEIFVAQGKAIAKNAASDVRVLVVGNPCNTNCLVAYGNGRAGAALDGHDPPRPQPGSQRAGREGRRRLRGRHLRHHLGQSLQHAVPRLHQRQDQGPAGDGSHHRSCLAGEHLRAAVPESRAAVIKARGASSALSAANGAIDHVKSLLSPTTANDWVSMATVSKGEYGVPAGIVCGYPCRSDGKGNYTVVQGVTLDAFGKAKFEASVKELLEERDAVKELIPS